MSAQAQTLEAALRSAMQSRRGIEAEMATIDSEIKAAIMNGDVAEYQRLTKRKAELPTLYIRASHAERNLADRIHGQARTDAEQSLAKATADHETQASSFVALQERHKREMEDAQAALKQSEDKKNGAQAEFIQANGVLTNSQEGCKRALGRVAEMF
jgi:hypothetical protein